jgi:hypothetical protein
MPCFCLIVGGGLDSQGWSTCMTSSMQLAQECLKDPPEASEEPPAPLEGLEMFAQTIETGESLGRPCLSVCVCVGGAETILKLSLLFLYCPQWLVSAFF